jgi:hypothetical protein
MPQARKGQSSFDSEFGCSLDFSSRTSSVYMRAGNAAPELGRRKKVGSTRLRQEANMLAGCTVLAAILLAIAASAMRLFPSFMAHLRMGLRLAGRSDFAMPRALQRGRARVIEFPLSRVASR